MMIMIICKVHKQIITIHQTNDIGFIRPDEGIRCAEFNRCTMWPFYGHFVPPPYFFFYSKILIQSFGSQCPFIKLYRKVPKCVCWLSIGFALRPESFVCEGKLRNLPLTSISTSPNKRSPNINQVNQNIISLNKGLLHTNKLKKRLIRCKITDIVFF